MKLHLGTLLFLFCVTVYALEEEADSEGKSRVGKLLPIFQVVRFPNDVCTGTTRNGTCFTAEECSNIGGTNEGSCASGFGVCCISALACGDSSSTNNSYIVQAGVTTLTSPCTYKICPCSTNICRIRYDLTTHTLASPVLGTAGAPSLVNNAAYGACTTDAFTITSPGNVGSPLICGLNSGQHMIIDSNGKECQEVNFHIGASTTTTRQWDIYVTQYNCGQEDTAGPPGCLQYMTGTSGTVSSFNFNPSNTATATDASTTHLQNQHYEICIRRESGYCYICYIPFNSITGAGTSSFGLGVAVADDAIAKSAIGSRCIADYIVIPQGTTSTIAALTTVSSTASERYCGRYLNTADDTAGNVSICSRIYPFRIGVVTDDTELCTNVAMTQLCEADTAPGGILGFSLNYVQSSC